MPEGGPEQLGSLYRAIHPDDRADFSRRWQEALETGHDLETEHRLRGRDGLYRSFVTRGRPIRGTDGQIREWVGSSTDIDDQMYAELNSRLLADVGQALSDRQSQPEVAGQIQAGQIQAGQIQAGQSQFGLTSGEDATTTVLPEFWSSDPGLVRALELMTTHFADSVALWPGPGLFGLDGMTGPDGPWNLAEAGREQRQVGPWSSPLTAGRARRIGLPELGQSDRLRAAVDRVLSRHEPEVFQGTELHPLGLSSAVLYPLLQDERPLGVLGLGFRQLLGDRDLELGLELAQRVTSALENRDLLARLHAAQVSLQDLNNSLEVRVAQRTLQLSDANSELEAFSYSVSHDLRTPLRHILGFVDLLRRESSSVGNTALSPKADRYLNIISQTADRMSKLIDDLLDFSRTSRAELRREHVDLGRLVREAQASLAPDQGDRQVDWKIGVLPTVIGDSALLRQVIDNLFSNALKYTRTREQALIEVQAFPHDREVGLSVHDNGVGFDAEYASKLFGVFQRLHRTEDFEGTGIGLANVRRIVSRHGGRVWAESDQQAGPGATFWVALPLEALSLEKGMSPEKSGPGRRNAALTPPGPSQEPSPGPPQEPSS